MILSIGFWIILFQYFLKFSPIKAIAVNTIFLLISFALGSITGGMLLFQIIFFSLLSYLLYRFEDTIFRIIFVLIGAGIFLI